MPKVTLKISPEQIQSAFDQLGMSRERIGETCGVHIDAVNKWKTKGRVPQEHWETLQRLLPHYGTANPAAAAKSAIQPDAGPGHNLPLPHPDATDLTTVPDRALIDELRRRGWDVTKMLMEAANPGKKI